MGFFKRSAPPGATSTAGAPPGTAGAPRVNAPPAPPDTTCTEAGCGRPASSLCAYADRRQRSCATPWCDLHLLDVAGSGYCRRHASVMRSLVRQDRVVGFAPDIDNRAPSLAEWVGNDLNAGALAILERVRGPRTDLAISTHELDLVLRGSPRGKEWQRAWTLSNHTGTALKLAIAVDETQDSELLLRVDSEAIGRIIPPWIAERARQLPPEIDAQWRRNFHDAVLAALDAAASRRQEAIQKHV